jgi:hypothetical protein
MDIDTGLFVATISLDNKTPETSPKGSGANHSQAVKPKCDLSTLILAEPPQQKKVVRHVLLYLQYRSSSFQQKPKRFSAISLPKLQKNIY